MNLGIYWLASYPKSGNTWLRTVISNYKHDLETPNDINNLQDNLIASKRVLFDEMICLESSDMNMDQIQFYQPYVYEELLKIGKKDLFIKIHDAYTFNKENKPLFPKKISKGVVYIVRNPLEVVVSNSNFNSITIEKAIERLNNENFILANSEKTLYNQLPIKIQSWSMHVESWLNSNIPICLIKYEDMIKDPYITFEKALSFLGFIIEEERLKKAIKFSSFEELKRQEEKKGFIEKPLTTKSFFREGKTNSYKNILKEEEIKKVIKIHKNTMLKLGYNINML